MEFEIDHNLQKIDEKSVIKCDDQLEIYTLGKIMETLNKLFNHTSFYGFILQRYNQIPEKIKISEKVFTDGIQCEILDTNYPSWVKGQLIAKVVLEFVPDEQPESKSPLDEIRREMEQNG